MGGILFVSVGSGGERILSSAYADFENLRAPENRFYLSNTSSKDHERVKLMFKELKIKDRTNVTMKVIGEETLSGYGAGKDWHLGLEAYEMDREKTLRELKSLHQKNNYKMAFTIATLGGGCGTMVLSEISRDIRDQLNLNVAPICTVPFRREGELLVNNASLGLQRLSEFGLNPLVYDNELTMRFSDSVKEGVERANHIIGSLISALVDLVEYGGFATPPIDIIDITRLVMPQCGLFSSVFIDNLKDFKYKWKWELESNKSLNSKTLDSTKCLVMFKARSFPHRMTEEVISHLRIRYRATEMIPSTVEDERFVGYTIALMLWGLSIDQIRPALRPKKPLREVMSFWR